MIQNTIEKYMENVGENWILETKYPKKTASMRSDRHSKGEYRTILK